MEEPVAETIDRRGFLKRSAVTTGGAVVAGSALQRLTERAAFAQSSGANGNGSGRGRSRSSAVERSTGYGPLQRMQDQRGVEVLALPAGFSYVTFGWTGSPMTEGGAHPRSQDGMGSFPGHDGTVRLIRNHESRTAAGDTTLGVPPNGLPKYDELANGGCTSLDFDPRSRQLVRSFTSIAGTHVNCAGGIAYGDAGWITSEETVQDTRQGYGKKHGYNFFVPATGAGKQTNPQPLTAMGRFAHEAVAVDPGTGIVYETEDAGNDSGFYRFIPTDPSNLAAGGWLQMLAVKNAPNYDAIRNQQIGTKLRVEWVTIDQPDPDLTGVGGTVFDQGADKGGAVQPARGHLVGRHPGQSLLQLHVRRQCGLRPGLGARAEPEPAAGRRALPAVRVAEQGGARQPGQPQRHPSRGHHPVRGRCKWR